MTADFQRVSVDDDNFIRGAARIMWAGITVPFPTDITSIIDTTVYDAQTGWNDLGATKSGIAINLNNSEETFDIDQILGEIDSRPTDWTSSVSTQLAQMTLETLQLAWEGSDIATVTEPGGATERQIGFGQPSTYTPRRLAVLFQKQNGKIRAYVFRKVQRAPQESSIQHAKTGEQQSVPVTFAAYADTSISDPKKRYFMIFDQS